MQFNDFFSGKNLHYFRITLLCLAGALLAFSLGVQVGYKRAEFSYKWAESYHQNFAGPSAGFFAPMGRDYMDANGVFGQVIDREPDRLTVRGQNDVETAVVVNAKTIIKMQKRSIKLSQIDVDDRVVVIGQPNASGQIEARLIRVMPPLPAIKDF